MYKWIMNFLKQKERNGKYKNYLLWLVIFFQKFGKFVKICGGQFSSVFTAIGKVFFCVFRKILRKQEKVIIRQSCHFPEFQEISSGSEVLTDCRGQVSNATHIGIHVLKVTNYLQIWVSEKSLVHSSKNSRKSQEKKTKK